MIDNTITHALDQVARQLGEARSADEVLDSITLAVRESIDEIDHVGISITHRNGRIETRSRTDDLVLQLDQSTCVRAPVSMRCRQSTTRMSSGSIICRTTSAGPAIGRKP